MSGVPYFPLLYEPVECVQCEIAPECSNQDRPQRNRRDFTYTSGRCPRLPDQRGFVEENQRGLYMQAFPLVHARRGPGALELTLTIPGDKRSKKVYQTKSGFWYFQEKIESGRYARRVLNFECYRSKGRILDYMDLCHSDYCVFRAVIEDYYI